jgi:hypothetical protein
LGGLRGADPSFFTTRARNLVPHAGAAATVESVIDQPDPIVAFTAPLEPLAEQAPAPVFVAAAHTSSGNATAIGILLIGTLVALPHLLDLFSVFNTYSSGALGGAVTGIGHIIDALFVLLGLGIIMRSNVARIIFLVLGALGALALVNDLGGGDGNTAGNLVALALQIGLLGFLMRPSVAATFA